MRFCLLSIAVSALSVVGQEPSEEGAKVFRLSCAQGYCHGSGGTQGRAPKLIGQVYDAAVVRKIIENGVAGTGMPGFKERLNAEQLTNVLYYVVKISSGDTAKINTGSTSAAAAGKAMPPEVAKGKAAFFEALKGVHRCSTCHALEDVGLAVGPNLSVLREFTTASIRLGRDQTIRQVTVDGEVFPGMIAEQKGDWVKVYDLTVAPPVRRTFAKDRVNVSGGANWKHSEAVKAYSDEDMQSVAAYLGWIADR